MITFQEIVQRLSEFWEKQGCILHMGHDLEVGAGTFNPATFLRCLGPEPYQTAYVEPSRRPSDARFGENPNRVQLFHQYQVILKPSPPNVQELYLQSLEAVGIKLKEHDIRFVHSDWESPTLGAWGLGWEVWCDGMEISQFTYFQAIGSLPLKPISAELTYGLERLAMYIQNVDSLFDLKWNKDLTFRDINHQMEVEWSSYNLLEANTAMWGRHFDDYEREAKMLILKNLPIPAYDFVLKASHAFNMLDARGVISVTERTGYIARVRDLARLVATEYLASREKMGFPLHKEIQDIPSETRKVTEKFNPHQKEDFLLEIGSEELPDTFIPPALTALEKQLRSILDSRDIAFDSLTLYATPRRLAAYISNLAEGSEDKQIEKRGPAISAAFESDGQLTPQGQGFLKSLGLPFASLKEIQEGSIKELSIRTIKDVDYLFVTLTQKGISTTALLAQELPNLILSLPFPKKMRWGNFDISYARPLHWIVALFGKTVVPFQVGDVASNLFSFGHRQRANEKIILSEPSVYLSELKKHFVMADIQERKTSILNALHQIETQLKGEIFEKEKVLPQVLHLTEWPQVDYASFDQKFLEIPLEVVASEMIEHQKYFPIKGKDGKLLPYFIYTADNTPSELIRKGNQKVLSARLNDGVFLYTQDLRSPLASFNEKLREVTFQKELGTVWDKVLRITELSQFLNNTLSLASQSKVDRACLLCKADLTSALVGEFPDLQGTIGKYYALHQKEDPEVASALEEHWFPKSENSPLPHTATGTIISLADKLDNLISYFRIGLKPTSSSDPYALRRQTLGILKILLEGSYPLDLRKVLDQFCHNQEVASEILHFITGRAKTLFEEYGFKKDEIEASLHRGCQNPFDELCKLKALHSFRQEGNTFNRLLEVYKRAKGQIAKQDSGEFVEALATEPAELELVRALHLLNKHWKETLTDKNYSKAFHMLAHLQEPLAKLFDNVKILADDINLRKNRIALLKKIFVIFEDLVDFNKIQ